MKYLSVVVLSLLCCAVLPSVVSQQWAVWEDIFYGKCKKNCRHYVNLTRTCQFETDCIGKQKLAYTETCTGGDCILKSSSSCFPGDARLLLDSGHVVQMQDVKAGQKILTVQDGKRVFSQVKTFLNRQPNVNATYLTLMTHNGNHVTLSESHLLFVSTDNSTNMETKFAKFVKPGDFIFSTHNCPRGLCRERVIHVGVSHKQGIYVPLTDEGTLVVDGIFASCYGSVQHNIAHFFMTPFRRFSWLLEPWQQDGYSPLITNMIKLGYSTLPDHVTFTK